MHIESVYEWKQLQLLRYAKGLAAVTVASPAGASMLSCDSVEGKAAWEVCGKGTGNLLHVVGL